MGTWGHKIFDSDLAADLRNEFRDAVAGGLSTKKATDRVLAAWHATLDDPEDGPEAWIALVEAQREAGRLDPRVKKQAIAVLASGGDLARWQREAPALASQREAVLKRLRASLDKPLPAAKKIKARRQNETELEAGDLLAFRLRDRVYLALWVSKVHEDRGGRSPVVVPLARFFEEPPTAAAAKRVEACWYRLRDPIFGGRWLSHIVFGMQRADDKAGRYRRITTAFSPKGKGRTQGGTLSNLTDGRLADQLVQSVLFFRYLRGCDKCNASGYDPALPESVEAGVETTALCKSYDPLVLTAGLCPACSRSR